MIEAAEKEAVINWGFGRTAVSDCVQPVSETGIIARRHDRPEFRYRWTEAQSTRITRAGALRAASGGTGQRVGIDISCGVPKSQNALAQAVCGNQAAETE